MISLDTETTGVDFRHGARPFFVTTCDENGDVTCWEWTVNPLTRKPVVPRRDIAEIRNVIKEADRIVLQNGKFDYNALKFLDPSIVEYWDWDKIDDTLIASHLLCSNRPHDLTSLGIQYLRVNISHYEDALEVAVKKARTLLRTRLKELGWATAKEGRIDMPSAKGSSTDKKDKIWKYDSWLPLELYKARDEIQEEFPTWETVLSDYGNGDSSVTLPLWNVLQREMSRRKLTKVYKERMRLVPVISRIEEAGVTLSEKRLTQMTEVYREESQRASNICVSLAASSGFELVMPKGSSSNKQILEVSEYFATANDCPKVLTESGQLSLKSESLTGYMSVLSHREPAWLFFKSLQAKRKRDTAVAYMEGYRRFMIPAEFENWYRLHPSLNQTGTDTLRCSSSNPNEQNISKKEGFNIRFCFGPAPDREWWSLDAKNIELRLPFYKAGEEVLIELFERPDDPPYYGSNHLANFHAVYPDIWDEVEREVGFEKVGPTCKKRFAGSWYQYCKNGGFCVPMDTEALTKEGWKKYGQVTENDMVLGLDRKTNTLKWTPVLSTVRFSGQSLIKVSNGHFQAVTTKEHRWVGKKRRFVDGGRVLVDNFCTSDTISTEQVITLSAPVEDEARLDISDVEASIIGFAYGDGSIEKSTKKKGTARGRNGKKVGFRVRLYQSKPKGIAWIIKTLAKWNCGFRRGERKDGSSYWDLNPGVCRDIWRRAGLWDTQDFESFVMNLGPSQRLAFLDGVFQAEGTMDSRGTTKHYSQNQGSFSEGIFLAIFLTGKSPSRSLMKEYYGSGKICQVIRECKPYVTGQRIKKEDVEGLYDVWCVTTALDTWVMRQNGRIMLTGNCKQYGGQKALTDLTFRRDGAFDLLESKFSKLSKLNRECIAFANKHGYIETMPDKSIDPDRGYPLMCTRTDYGKIKPTVPLSYYIQGTAMWWTARGMVRTQEKLDEWNRQTGFDGKIVMQIHDEVVLDFPKSRVHPKNVDEKKLIRDDSSNLWRIRIIQKLMEQCGTDLGIPTPVGVEYHDSNWSDGVTF